MSKGFTGAATRGMEEIDREIETRLTKLDAFTDEFSPPGVAEKTPGQDYSKGDGDTYGKPHDDIAPSEPDRPAPLDVSKSAEEQAASDIVDRQQQIIEGGLKPQNSQLPGANPDPAAITTSQPLTSSTLGAADVEIEKRLTRLNAEAPKGTTTIAVMHGDHLLMGTRRDNGKWTMPGGGMEAGEAPLSGAIRELKEEAGIDAASLEHLSSETVSGRTGRKVTVHAFKLKLDAKPVTRTTADPDQEVERWQWIDVKDGLPSSVTENLQSPRNTLLIHLGLLK